MHRAMYNEFLPSSTRYAHGLASHLVSCPECIGGLDTANCVYFNRRAVKRIPPVALVQPGLTCPAQSTDPLRSVIINFHLISLSHTFRPTSVPLTLRNGCPPHPMPNLPATLTSHATNTSQTTRSTMPPTIFPQGWHPSHSACPLAVRLCIRVDLASSVAPPLDPPCDLRNPAQGLQISSTTQRKLVDTIRLRRSECSRPSYAPSGCATVVLQEE